jgi:hypothetical protein
MQQFGKGLRQPVRQGLQHDLVIVVEAASKRLICGSMPSMVTTKAPI